MPGIDDRQFYLILKVPPPERSRNLKMVFLPISIFSNEYTVFWSGEMEETKRISLNGNRRSYYAVPSSLIHVCAAIGINSIDTVSLITPGIFIC